VNVEADLVFFVDAVVDLSLVISFYEPSMPLDPVFG
jgi:hypothetical protein